MIRLVLLDVGNVIVLAMHDITTAALVRHHIRPDLAKRFFANEAYAEFARGRLSPEEFYEFQRMNLQTQLPYDAIVATHDEHMYGVDREVLDVISRLATELAFATDTNPWQTARERRLVRLDYFRPERIFRSNELGALKRDPGTFDRIVRELDRDPNEILFVDDSPEKVEQAQLLGLKTVRFESAASLARDLSRYDCLR